MNPESTQLRVLTLGRKHSVLQNVSLRYPMTLQIENVCSTDIDMTFLYLDADILM